jgi:hypothetical protein
VKTTHFAPHESAKTSHFSQKSGWHHVCFLQLAECAWKVVRRDERHMRTLLRKVSTGLYFRGPDQWTRNPAEAHNFKMIDRAVQFVEQWKLQDMELAFAFADEEEVTRVPIDKMALRYSER